MPVPAMLKSLRRSLRLRLTAVIVVCVGSLALLFLMVASWTTSRFLAAELEQDVRDRMQLVAENIAPLLERFDHLTLAQWLDTLMLLPGVAGVEVRSEDQWTLAVRGELAGTALHQGISREQIVLGSVTVYLRPQQHQKKVWIVTVLGLDGVALGLPLLFFIIWRLCGTFLRDLQALADKAEQIGDVTDLRLPGRERGDEVGRLARLLERRSREIREGAETMRLLNKAIEQANEAVVITDREGNIHYVNPSYSRITGSSAEEILGQALPVLQSDREDRQVSHGMWAALAEGQSWSGQLSSQRKDGRGYEEKLSISPIRTESGVVTHYVAVIRDVSAELLLERRLRQAQRLEAVGTLAGGIAHEFNNILTVIRGNLEMLLYTMTPDNPLHLQLKEMQQSASRAADLVRQLMFFRRQGGGGGQLQRLDSVMRGVQSLLQTLAGERIRLRLELSETWPVLMEPGLLEQMLNNLVQNGRDAIDGTGEIVLRVENRSFDADTAVGSARPGRFVMLSVHDSGRGMTPEVMDQLFDPFFSTKETAPGRGLGLAVVYGLVRQLDGWIEVESSLGRGSELRIFLPVREEGTGEASVIADPRAQSLFASGIKEET
ncbi:MAG: hypothetical protein BWK76_16635 [Desulfobulbaceae bacterium A2]|nr:MAG: hypothetical protein BWK76_16635 [Desulfobulbaceae bacterium A2]